MKNYAIGTLLIFSCTLAYGASWKNVMSTSNSRTYVDTSSIIKMKTGKKFWVRHDYNAAQIANVYINNAVRTVDYYQIKVLYMTKCQQNTIAGMQAVYFDKKGASLGVQHFPKKLNFYEVIPDSFEEKALRFVCGKSKSVKKK